MGEGEWCDCTGLPKDFYQTVVHFKSKQIKLNAQMQFESVVESAGLSNSSEAFDSNFGQIITLCKSPHEWGRARIGDCSRRLFNPK